MMRSCIQVEGQRRTRDQHSDSGLLKRGSGPVFPRHNWPNGSASLNPRSPIGNVRPSTSGRMCWHALSRRLMFPRTNFWGLNLQAHAPQNLRAKRVGFSMQCRGCQDDSRKRLSKSSKRWSRSTAKAREVFLLAVGELCASIAARRTHSSNASSRFKQLRRHPSGDCRFIAPSAPRVPCEQTKPPALVFPKAGT